MADNIFDEETISYAVKLQPKLLEDFDIMRDSLVKAEESAKATASFLTQGAERAEAMANLQGVGQKARETLLNIERTLTEQAEKQAASVIDAVKGTQELTSLQGEYNKALKEAAFLKGADAQSAASQIALSRGQGKITSADAAAQITTIGEQALASGFTEGHGIIGLGQKLAEVPENIKRIPDILVIISEELAKQTKHTAVTAKKTAEAVDGTGTVPIKPDTKEETKAPTERQSRDSTGEEPKSMIAKAQEDYAEQGLSTVEGAVGAIPVVGDLSRMIPANPNAAPGAMGSQGGIGALLSKIPIPGLSMVTAGIGALAGVLGVVADQAGKAQEYTQLTGGTSVAESMQYQAKARMMALSPFLSTDQANEIINTTLGSGADGREADTIMDFIAKNVEDGTLSAVESMEMYRTVVRDAGGSTDSIAKSLESLRLTADEGDVSLEKMVNTMKTLTTEYASMGIAGEQPERLAEISTEMFAPVAGLGEDYKGLDLGNDLLRLGIADQVGLTSQTQVRGFLHTADPADIQNAALRAARSRALRMIPGLKMKMTADEIYNLGISDEHLVGTVNQIGGNVADVDQAVSFLAYLMEGNYASKIAEVTEAGVTTEAMPVGGIELTPEQVDRISAFDPMLGRKVEEGGRLESFEEDTIGKLIGTIPDTNDARVPSNTQYFAPGNVPTSTDFTKTKVDVTVGLNDAGMEFLKVLQKTQEDRIIEIQEGEG